MTGSVSTRRTFLAATLASGSLRALPGQQSAYVPNQNDRPELLAGDEAGFQPIFDGKTLDGWHGDPKYWRVMDGSMVGEITRDTLIKSNTFLIWRGGAPGDFDLKVDYRITSGGNSGINYRSRDVPDKVTPENKFAMRGYQCDIDGADLYTGNNYEEKGRLFLSVRGQVTRVTGERKPAILASLGDSKELAGHLTKDWNSIHLSIRGNVLMHYINGRCMSITIDDDPMNRAMAGLIGVQVHVGGPMKVEYRKWRLKRW